MITERIKEFKKKLKDSYVVGPFSKTSDPGFIEIMGHAGMDFVIIDLEHGPNSVQTAQDLIRAAHLAHTLPIVRVKEDSPSIIGEVLDVGAGGIHVPQVVTSESAKEVIERARFAPEGMRGVCRYVRAADYSSKDRFEYFKEANEAVIILGLEGTQALENVDQIIAVEGIDIIFVGPYDLSQSLGITGKIDDPLVAEQMTRIIDKCVRKGIAVGTFVETIENAIRWRDLGIKYLCYSVDVGIFYDACQRIIHQIRSAG